MTGAMHRSRVSAGALLVALLTMTGCGGDAPAQVMVYVQAEEGIRARATRLEVRVEGGPAVGGREARETLTYSGPDSDEGFNLQWPLRIALVPEGGDVSRTFRVTALATDADGLVAEASVIGGYLPGEALALHVWLRDVCLGVACPGEDETCTGGTCGPVATVDPCSLETLEGARPKDCDPVDAAVPVDAAEDAGSPDAVVDAGEPDAGAPDAGSGPTAVHNVVFVTSTRQQAGSIGGLSEADAICRARAEAGGLPRPNSYVAWLSDADEAAPARLAGSQGWVRTDGLPVVNTVTDLINGIIYYPPALDENGIRPAPSNAVVATGTRNNGTVQYASDRCSEWTSSSGNLWPGNALDATDRWSQTGTLSNCAAEVAILCFGTGLTAPIDPPDATGSLVFVSKGALPGRDTADVSDGGVLMGVERFDTMCQAEADAEGLTGTFVALLGTAGQSALDRLPSAAAPWVRPDGVLVAENKLAIAQEHLLAPITVTVDQVQYANRTIWAGAADPGAIGNNNDHCSNWLDGSYGKEGRSGSTFNVFFSNSFVVCGGQRHVLCFQTTGD
jgi:hypothetical protein